MKDLLDNDIESGKIICYTRSVENKQRLGFGIVLDPEAAFGYHTKVKVIPLETISVPANLFKVKRLYKNDTYTITLSPHQLWILNDTSNLPQGLVDALINAYNLHFKRLVSAEEWKEEIAELSPGERYQRYVLRNTGNREFEQMQQDIMNV